MNIQEIWATKAEFCKMTDKIQALDSKIDKLTQMVALDSKIDKLIQMVDVIDFVPVSATSKFASSSFKFDPVVRDTVSCSSGLPEPEVTEVPEVTKLERSMASTLSV
jgi:hypothetical protein